MSASIVATPLKLPVHAMAVLASLLVGLSAAVAAPCPAPGLAIQPLAFAAPTLPGARQTSGTLVWLDGRARLLVNVGPGTVDELVAAGARLTELDAILLTQLGPEYTGDLPWLISAMRATGRSRPIMLYGPAGDLRNPSTVGFTRALFDGKRGAWRGLGGVLSPLSRTSLHLKPFDMRFSAKKPTPPITFGGIRLIAAPIHAKKTMPRLLWRIEGASRVLVFADDPAASSPFTTAASGADLWVTEAVSGNGGVQRLSSAARIRLVGQGYSLPETQAPSFTQSTAVRQIAARECLPVH